MVLFGSYTLSLCRLHVMRIAGFVYMLYVFVVKNAVRYMNSVGFYVNVAGCMIPLRSH